MGYLDLGRYIMGSQPAFPAPWFRMLRSWAGSPLGGTTSTDWGINRASSHVLLRAYSAITLLFGAINTVNVFTALSDSARYRVQLSVWDPIIWEFTSGIATLAVCGIAYLALRTAAPKKAPWAVVLLVHGGTSLLFSVLHVGLMAAARSAVYGIMGLHYRMAISEWPYEYRKDLLAYILLIGIFWVFARGKNVTGPSTFDIIDGSNLIRVPLSNISAVHAAGNYVEFRLIDGRAPLMRASMRQMEDRLQPHGFVRTHRSWIVNRANLKGIMATGSGDFDLEVEGGVTLPLSRRYSRALATLRVVQDRRR